MKNKTCLFIYSFSIIAALLLIISGCKKNAGKYNTVTDIDGNAYHTVAIGKQVWLVENLKVTRYRNGDQIPNVSDNKQWCNLTTGAYCNYNNDANNVTTYGRLYNWYAVHDIRNIAPKGWHVATDVEWKILTDYLGGETIAGGKLKETGTTLWQYPNKDAENKYGFSALPGGGRFSYGSYSYIRYIGLWWSATEVYTFSAWLRYFSYYYSDAYSYIGSKGEGLSVRCIKDK